MLFYHTLGCLWNWGLILIYEPVYYFFVSQWDLVCDSKKLNQAVATFFFIGVTIGAVIFGYLSDKYVIYPIRI